MNVKGLMVRSIAGMVMATPSVAGYCLVKSYTEMTADRQKEEIDSLCLPHLACDDRGPKEKIASRAVLLNAFYGVYS